MQTYTLILIYYQIRFGIIRFGSVRIPKLWYSVGHDRLPKLCLRFDAVIQHAVIVWFG